MRKSAMLTVVTMLLGGCAALTPPPPEARPAPAPAPAPAAPAVSDARPLPATAPKATPRRQQAVRIDNSSLESFRVSWERLHASLSPTQQADLNEVVVHLTFEDYGGVTNIPANLRNSPIVPEMVRDRIAGLTYAEIIALSP